MNYFEKYQKYKEKYELLDGGKTNVSTLSISNSTYINNNSQPYPATHRGTNMTEKIIIDHQVELISHVDENDVKCCIDTLGSGSYGTVFRGINTKTNKTIIIKKNNIKRNSLRIGKNPHLIKIEKEIRIMQDLDHPNIIKYIGYSGINQSDDDKNDQKPKEMSAYIYMEDVCGNSLKKIANNIGGFSLEMIRNCSKQILEGLYYLHNKKIIHYDIKSDNVLLSNDGIIKIIDFGESDIISGESFTLGVKGTYIYMAPEMINLVKNSVDEFIISKDHLGKTDIWSLGILLGEIFVGKMILPDDIVKKIEYFREYIQKYSGDFAEYMIKIIMDNICYKIFPDKSTIGKGDDNNYHIDSNNFDCNEFIFELVMDGGFNPEISEILCFVDFILCCLEIDYKTRCSTIDLLDHPFINQNCSDKYKSRMVSVITEG